ncbi:MAG TPA: YHS domain-containing protein [Gemmatimonadaceae bacterium]|nr:YHS domain-containing protein [Gemmatimonadaceae bacterium]
MMGLLWLLLWAGILVLMMRFGCGAHMGHGRHRAAADHEGHDHRLPEDTPLIEGGGVDPVCGRTVAANQGYRIIRNGAALHFCSKPCLDKFEASPRRYLIPVGGVR